MGEVAVLGCVALTGINLLVTVVLFRQLGLFVMGTARGAHDSGIALGRRLPSFELEDLGSGGVRAVPSAGTAQLVVFANTACKECARMFPDLREFAAETGTEVSSLVFGDNPEAVRRYARRMSIEERVFFCDQDTGRAFDIENTPFGFAVNERGVIVAKGLLNNREQVLSLFRSVSPPDLLPTADREVSV